MHPGGLAAIGRSEHLVMWPFVFATSIGWNQEVATALAFQGRGAYPNLLQAPLLPIASLALKRNISSHLLLGLHCFCLEWS